MGKRDFLTVLDLSAEEFLSILAEARALKERPRLDLRRDAPMAGRVLGMLFQKSSTRTRVSFEVGMERLGGRGLFLSASDLQLGRGESISDTARVLSRYVDVLMARVFAHSVVERLAEAASVPVINGLSDDHHPCQALADLLTVLELKGDLEGRTLAYVGDGNNVCHSLLEACAAVGMNMRAATPEGYEPDERILTRARATAEETGATLEVTRSPKDAVAGADVVYTDVWASMGQEGEAEERRRVFAAYRVDEALMEAASPEAIFLHCLPAHRGEEVTDGVMDGRWSAVWRQAENRMWTQMALLLFLSRKE